MENDDMTIVTSKKCKTRIEHSQEELSNTLGTRKVNLVCIIAPMETLFVRSSCNQVDDSLNVHINSSLLVGKHSTVSCHYS